MDEICIETKNLTKQYPGTRALDNVNYFAIKGAVNAIVGENGAGKSTLMKILAGNILPTEGEIFLNGEKIEIKSVEDAKKHGVGIIHQELNLFPNLTVADNVFVGKNIITGITINHIEQYKRTKSLLDRLRYHIDPQKRVSELRVGEKQIVEIVKTLSEDNLRILIMDEPTSSLSNVEVEILFDIIDDLKKMGITVLYISHRLEEILKISDHISVLRDGKLVAQKATKEVSLEWIAEKMVGQSQVYDYHDSKKKIGTTIMSVKNLSLYHPDRGKLLDNVSFDIGENEVLGVYGLLGSGRTELMQCIMGLHKHYTGKILLNNIEVKLKNIRSQISKGFFLVPEERQREGLLHKSSIRDNLALSSLSKFASAGVISNKVRNKAVNTMIGNLQVKFGHLDDLITSLSGGNQQKIVIGKGLLTNPTMLLLDEPTKGVDIGAKHELFKLISKLSSEEKLSIILVSSEIKEILSISDRIIVISDGRITGEFTGLHMTKENVYRAASIKKAGVNI